MHIGMHGWHFRCIFDPCAKLSLASLKSVLPPMLMENLWTKMSSDPSMGSLRELAKPAKWTRASRERDLDEGGERDGVLQTRTKRP
jgi:hypothetical protein